MFSLVMFLCISPKRPSSIPCGPQLGPVGPDWGPFGNAAWSITKQMTGLFTMQYRIDIYVWKPIKQPLIKYGN